MAISSRAAGAWASGSTSVAPAIPAGSAAGDRMVLFVGCKPFNATIATPTGWTPISGGSGTNGSTASGIDTGSVRWATFYRDWVSGDAAPTVSITSGNVALAVINGFQKGAGEVWMGPTASSGSDTSSGTGFSLTMSANPGVTVNDMLVTGSVIAGDNATFGTPTITATSATIGSVTESPATEGTTLTGNDLEASASYALCTAGTGTAAPVVGWTLSVAQTGGGSLVRLRVANGIIVQGEEEEAGITPSRRRESGLLDVTQSLLLSTLAAAAVTSVPRDPVMFSVQPKPQVSAEVVPNLLTRSSVATPIASQPIRLVPQRPAIQADTAQNLTAFLPPASTVQTRTPVYFSPVKRQDVQDTSRPSSQVLIGQVVVRPFFAPAFDTPQARKAIGGPFFPERGVDAQAPAAQGVPFLSGLSEPPARRRTAFDPPPPNLSTSTLDVQPIASAQCEFPPLPRRAAIPSAQQSVSPAVLLATPVVRPFSAPPFDASMRRTISIPLLGWRGMDAGAPAPQYAPFVPPLFETVYRRRVQPDTALPNLLTSTLDLPQIATAQTEWPILPRLPRINADTSASSPRVLQATPVFRPFSAPMFDQAMRRPLNGITFDLPGVYVAEPPIVPIAGTDEWRRRMILRRGR